MHVKYINIRLNSTKVHNKNENVQERVYIWQASIVFLLQEQPNMS